MDKFIKTANEFRVDKVNFGAMKVLETGGRNVYISYEEGNNPLIVQTPEMYAPFGVSSFSNDAGDPNAQPIKYSLDLAFKNVSTKASERCFLKVLKEFDRRVIATTFENSMAWLKKKFQSLEVIEALYTHSIKVPKDRDTGDVTDKYPPSFKMTIPTKDGKFMCDAYDVDGSDLDLASMIKDGSIKGANVTAIMRCTGIWIAGGKFGCSWRAMQIRVRRPNALPPCAFAYDDDEFGTKVEDSDDDIDMDCAAGPDVNKMEESVGAVPLVDVKMEEVGGAADDDDDEVAGPVGSQTDTATSAQDADEESAAAATASTASSAKKRGAPKKK